MKRHIALLAIFSFIAVAVGWLFWDHLRPSAQGGGLQSIRGRPGLVVRSADDKGVDLSKIRGRIAVIHFWATWCPPCIQEMPDLMAFWNRYKSRKDIELFAIATDKESWEKVAPFLKENQVDLPVFCDPGGQVAERFGTSVYPETYIINRNGRVVQKVAEVIAWRDPQVQAFFDQLLASAE